MRYCRSALIIQDDTAWYSRTRADALCCFGVGDALARPLLLVHGFGASQNMWNNQIPGVVDARLRCITFDCCGQWPV
jgi:pimeloyl-ACP methyl ester carboxylesterase